MSDLDAHYDPRTGRIKADSRLIYLHEYRHSQQPQKIMTLVSYMLLIPLIMMAVFGFMLMNFWLLIISVPQIIILMVLEIDAWIYAIREYRNDVNE